MLDEFERRLVNEVTLLVNDNERLKSDLEMTRKANASNLIELLLLGAMLSDIWTALPTDFLNRVGINPKILNNAYQTFFKRSPKAADALLHEGDSYVGIVFQEREGVEQSLVEEWKTFVGELRKTLEALEGKKES